MRWWLTYHRGQSTGRTLKTCTLNTTSYILHYQKSISNERLVCGCRCGWSQQNNATSSTNTCTLHSYMWDHLKFWDGSHVCVSEEAIHKECLIISHLKCINLLFARLQCWSSRQMFCQSNRTKWTQVLLCDQPVRTEIKLTSAAHQI